MPAPDDCDMMRFGTPILAHSGRYTAAASVVLQASRRHWKAGKQGAICSPPQSHTDIVADAQLGREEFVDVLPPVALWRLPSGPGQCLSLAWSPGHCPDAQSLRCAALPGDPSRPPGVQRHAA